MRPPASTADSDDFDLRVHRAQPPDCLEQRDLGKCQERVNTDVLAALQKDPEDHPERAEVVEQAVVRRVCGDLVKEFGPYFKVAAQRLDGDHALGEEVVRGAVLAGAFLMQINWFSGPRTSQISRPPPLNFPVTMSFLSKSRYPSGFAAWWLNQSSS